MGGARTRQVQDQVDVGERERCHYTCTLLMPISSESPSGIQSRGKEQVDPAPGGHWQLPSGWQVGQGGHCKDRARYEMSLSRIFASSGNLHTNTHHGVTHSATYDISFKTRLLQAVYGPGCSTA